MSSQYSLIILFEISKVKKSTYYKWLKLQHSPTIKQLEDLKIVDNISKLFLKHKGRYGVDRMTHSLYQDFNIKCNRKKVYRLMKENGYLAVIKEKKKYTPYG